MLRRDVPILFAGSMICAAFGFGSSVVISRWLGPDGRGLLALAMWMPSIICALGLMGQDSVNMTFAGLYKNSRRQLLLQSLAFAGFAGLLSAGIIGPFLLWLPVPKGNFAALSREMVLISCLFPPVTVLNTLLIALLRGVGRVGLTALLQVFAQATVFVLLVLFVAGLGHGAKTALWISVLAPLPSSALAIWYLRRETWQFSDLPFRVILGKSLKVGLPIGVAVVATFLISRLDQGLLGYMATKADVGLYAVAATLAEQVRILPFAITQAFLPLLASDLKNRQGQVPAVFRAAALVSVGAMVMASVAGVAAIIFVYGRQFAGSVAPFLLLLPGIAALGSSVVLISDLLTREKTHYNVKVSWSTLVVSATLNFALIPVLGICGAAIAGTVSNFWALALWIRFYLRESGRDFGELVPGQADFRSVYASSLDMMGKLAPRIVRPFLPTVVSDGAAPDNQVPIAPGDQP